jgi:hypothetical protein
MKRSILRLGWIVGVLMSVAPSALAMGGTPEIPDLPHGPKPPAPATTKVPEIPAKGLAAGVLLVLGGAAVLIGRRRRNSGS